MSCFMFQVSQLEKYHGVVKDAFGLAQKMVLVLILRVIGNLHLSDNYFKF